MGKQGLRQKLCRGITLNFNNNLKKITKRIMFLICIKSYGAQEHAGEILKTMLCASGTWTTDRETSCPPPDGEVGYLGQNTDACQGDSGGNCFLFNQQGVIV